MKKPSRQFGIAVLLALIGMAFSSAPVRAESTGLCDVDAGKACPAGHSITHVHETSVERRSS